MIFRDIALLGARVTLGSYLGAHGAQKLWGHFGGPGFENASQGFHHMGLRPGPAMAGVASTSELTGGILTGLGLAWPIGPIAIGAAMATASTAHRANGAFSAKGGFELPLTNLALASALAVAGPGRLSLDTLLRARVPRWFVAATFLTAAAGSAYTANQVITHARQARENDVSEPAPEPEPVRPN